MKPAAASAQPRLSVFAGPNGSRNSTILGILRPEWIGPYVNADEIEKQLRQSGALDLNSFELMDPVEALQRRISGHLAASELLAKHGLLRAAEAVAVTTDRRSHLPQDLASSYVAAVLANAIRRALLAQGSTFTFETVMSSRDKIAIMRAAQALGYRTYLYFVATDVHEINISRLQLRVSQGGHDVPEGLIRSRHVRSIGLLDDACAAISAVHQRVGAEIHPKQVKRAVDELIARGAVRFEGDKRWRRYWAA